jgi:hypothetical protein
VLFTVSASNDWWALLVIPAAWVGLHTVSGWLAGGRRTERGVEDDGKSS